MIEYVTHAYKIGTEPFQSLSSLPESEAVKIMEEQYVKGSLLWDRFANPKGYWTIRKAVETWLYTAFIAKGGYPKQTYPIYMVVGAPHWIETHLDGFTKRMTQEIQVPLSLFEDDDISFSYPDSMASWLLAQEKHPHHYQAGYHGEVFTRSEIMTIISEKGLPDEGWDTNVPDDLPHYIEAQVWNREVLTDYMAS